MSDRKSLECHSMTMSDDEHYGVFKESEVRELETERNELLSKAEKLESRLIESKEKSDHYKGYLDEYREMWFDRELGEKNPVVIENTKLKKQLNIAVEALE
ncbi:MAG: hypothetical protein GY797_30895, partial [Deltaproteobacteria bacterium]|nr:hypothetical protein [Deltaproteobacteria bacterium]